MSNFLENCTSKSSLNTTYFLLLLEYICEEEMLLLLHCTGLHSIRYFYYLPIRNLCIICMLCFTREISATGMALFHQSNVVAIYIWLHFTNQTKPWPHTNSKLTVNPTPSKPRMAKMSEATVCDVEVEEDEYSWPHIQTMFSLRGVKKNSYIMQWLLCLPKQTDISAQKTQHQMLTWGNMLQ